MHPEPPGLDEHPAEARVDGQPCQGPSVCREPWSALGPPSSTAPAPASVLPARAAAPFGPKAPSSSSRRTPSATCRASGASTNGNRATSPSPSAAIWRMTDASEVRWISGSVNSGLAS